MSSQISRLLLLICNPLSLISAACWNTGWSCWLGLVQGTRSQPLVPEASTSTAQLPSPSSASRSFLPFFCHVLDMSLGEEVDVMGLLRNESSVIT